MKTIFYSVALCLMTISIASSRAKTRPATQQSAPPAQVGAQQLPSIEVENWNKPQPGWLYVLDPRPNVGETGGHIWLLDPETGTVMGSIHTGYHPDFALAPDGNHLFIASDTRMHTTELAVVETSTGEVFAGEKIVGRSVPTLIPQFSVMAVSGDNRFLRILVKTPDSENFQLDTIDADSGQLLPGIVHLGNCGNGQFVSFPTADQVDVACPNVKKVHIVRTDERSKELDNIYGQWPWERRLGFGGAFAAPGGQYIAIVRGDGAIFQMDAVTLSTYATAAHGSPEEQITPSVWPRSADGGKIYIGNSHAVNAANAIAREIRVYDTTTWKKLSSMKTSIPFWSLVSSPEANRLYAIAPEQHSILVIDSSTMRELRSINIGAMPALALVAP
jgi:DNA-binding beta-propeller fold protein YncE